MFSEPEQEGNDLSDAALGLLKRQMLEWPAVGKRFGALRHILVRRLALSTCCHVAVQFNPDRIRSSAADISPKALEKRLCFLCPQGRDPLQRSLPIGDYSIQVNPFPIFPAHFTVTYFRHTPQRLQGRFTDFLCLMNKLSAFTLFYNGPHSGASAPDHLHFQACTRGVMPLEEEWRRCPCELVERQGDVRLWNVKELFRTVFVLQGDSPETLTHLFGEWCRTLPVKEGEYEPRMNVIGTYDHGQYTLFLLPRNRMRPSCFYAGDEKRQLTVSPASVEMGGLFITPLEKDYRKITAEDAVGIYDECTLKI